MRSRREPRAGDEAGAGGRGSIAVGLAAHALVSLLLCAAMVAWLDPACIARLTTQPPSPLEPALLVANALPVVLASLLLLGLTRRPLLSIALPLLLLYVLYVANAVKLTQLDTPVLPADFLLLAHLGDGGELLAHYLPRRMQMALVVAFGAALLVALREPPWRRLRGPGRALVLAAAGVLGASLLLGASPWPAVYAAGDDAFNTWTPKGSARAGGLPATLLRYLWRVAAALPEPDGAQARRLVAAHPPAPIAPAPAEWPDIVVLQSESFFDAARLRGLEPAQVLPQFRRLAARSRHGDLWVPTFGGGTIRTEFEVLTGLAMRYFPDVQYPYFRLTTRSLESLASVLGARGYRTIAVHPNVRAFWNRASALASMGFDAFQDVASFPDAARVGYYTSDDALVEHLLRELDRAEQPLFLFAISMENHGPYVGYPNADPARIAAEPVPAGVDGEAAAHLQGYLYHLANADRALGRLADALARRPRRSLLLFYGDHLPALPEVYDRIAFDDGHAAFEQPTPWLLYDTAHDASVRGETAAFYLPTLLLEAAGIADGDYFDVLGAVRRADAPARHWTPVEDDGLRAMALLRQRGEPIGPPGEQGSAPPSPP